MHNIHNEIIKARKRRIAEEGYASGVKLSRRRTVPLQPFHPTVICEIKQRSPSRGAIGEQIDPLQQAAMYHQAGIQTISVLTETDYFSGSLRDLYRIKQAFPSLAVLRKDFLLDAEDILTSYRAGADAILLLASMHSKEEFTELYNYARSLGLAVLSEVYSKEDIAKLRTLQPEIVGINCRNLHTFTVDRLHPLVMMPLITWDALIVYESGIMNSADADFAFDCGFNAVLCGEAVMRNKDMASELLQSAAGKRPERIEHPQPRFWQQIASLLQKKQKKSNPLVKICGICSKEDALHAQKVGADILGFIFAESPRKTDTSLLHELHELPILKVAVVTGEEHTPLMSPVSELLEKGYIDAVQLHGQENPADCAAVFPSYKVLRLKTPELPLPYPSPRLLLDKWHAERMGGTGMQVDAAVLQQWRNPLWLAGGIGVDNVVQCIKQWNPELIDASSRLEEYPGKKDHTLLNDFFNAIKSAETPDDERESNK